MTSEPRTETSGPALRRFVRRVAAFGLLFAIVSAGLHSIVVRVFETHTALGEVQREYEEHDGPFRLLILGDSHARAAVDDARLPRAFNFATDGESYLQTYYKLRAVLDEHPEVDTVLLGFDLHSLSSFRELRVDDDWYWTRFLDYPRIAAEHVAPDFFAKWIGGTVAGYAGSAARVSWLLHTDVLPALRGEDVRDLARRRFARLSPERRSWVAEARAGRHFDDVRVPSSVDITYLERILAETDARGVRVVLVQFPVTASYLEAVPLGVWATMDDLVPRLLRRYGNVVGFWDELERFADSPRLFQDQDHLNHRGARRFTRLLSRRLEALHHGRDVLIGGTVGGGR